PGTKFASVDEALAALDVDVSGDQLLVTIQNIGTSEEAIGLGSLNTSGLGWCWLKNLDDTNYVEIRGESGGADLIRLNAGEAALFRLAADATPYGIANTAACDLAIAIIEA